jgi:hypothetical protein
VLALAAPGLHGLQEPRTEPPALTGIVHDGAARSEDPAAGLAFVELARPRDTYLVHEPFTLRLRIGFERGFLASGLVPLFKRELELPVQVHAPWLAALAGARALTASAVVDGPRLALGEEVVRTRRAADETRAGTTYAVFELERTYVAVQPGTLRLEAPLVRFAAATRFEDDFVNGRLALDRRELAATGAGAELVIAPLPEAGRPPDFTGAIGRFTIRAAAEPRELVAGTSLALEVVVEGEGELSQVTPPRLDDLAGFHVRGALAEHADGRLVLRYDLVPRSAGVRAVPPVHFAYFDTGPPAGYRTLTSEPIPLVVRPADAGRAPESAPPARPSGPRMLTVVLGGLAVRAALALLVRRARSA